MRATIGRGIAALAIGAVVLGGGAVAGATPAEAGPWLGLAGGDVGAVHWSVQAKRPDGPAGAGRKGTERPCLLVGTIWRTGPYSFHRSRSRECTGEEGLSPSAPPLVARGVQSSSGGAPRLTAVGMIFAASARSLEVTLADGTTKTIHLSVLSPRKAREAGLSPFRFAAFATPGEWCAERLVSKNASGRVLWDSGVDGYTCGDHSDPPRFAG
jgi:hypothetical protein